MASRYGFVLFIVFGVILLTAIQLFIISLVHVDLRQSPLPVIEGLLEKGMGHEGISMLQMRSLMQRKKVAHIANKTIAHGADKDGSPGLVTIFSAQCKPYHDWQSVTLADTWRAARMPGTLVRILACSNEQRKYYKREHLVSKQVMETWVHDDLTFQGWSTLNKPGGIYYWVTHGSGASLPDDAVIFLLDPDISFREDRVWETLKPLVERAKTGVPIGINCSYILEGMQHNNMSLPLKFLPRRHLSRLQSLAPPILIRKDQLQEMAFGWYNISKTIMANESLLGLIHDGAVESPWITEMYGYSISAAASLPMHETQREWPMFQSKTPPYAGDSAEMPLLLHYAHSYRLCGRLFGKRNLYKFDLLDCSLSKRMQNAIRPPSASTVRNQNCHICVGQGDVFAKGPFCLPPINKIVSYEAWARVYIAIMKWRAMNCPAATNITNRQFSLPRSLHS